MLDQILDLVKHYGQQTVVDNPEVPNEYNNAVLSEASKTITGGLQNMISGGGLQGILSLFANSQGQGKAGLMANPVVNMMVGHFTNKLVSNFNLNPGVASVVANNLIPSVLNSLISKTQSNAPSDSNFNLNDLIGSLTGGGATAAPAANNGIDFQGLLNQFLGGQNVNLDNDYTDITRRAQQSQQQGGLTDLIQGFFK